MHNIPSLSLDPQQLLDAALKAGASQAEIYWSAGQSNPVTFEGNRLKQVEHLESEGVALRVWREGRCGLAVACGATNEDSTLAYLVDKALALSELGRPDEILLGERSPSTWQLAPQTINVATLVELGNSGIEQLRHLQPEAICNGELSFFGGCDRAVKFPWIEL